MNHSFIVGFTFIPINIANGWNHVILCFFHVVTIDTQLEINIVHNLTTIGIGRYVGDKDCGIIYKFG